MAKNWYPVIDDALCVECGACTDKCAKGVYEEGTMPPVVVNPDNCSFGCNGCSKLCPVDAITYYQGDEPQLFNMVRSGCGCS